MMELNTVGLPIYPSTQFTLSEDGRTFSVEASDLGLLEKFPEVIRIRYRAIVYSFSLTGVRTRDGDLQTLTYLEPVLGRSLIIYND